jgi:hypothetical protein
MAHIFEYDVKIISPASLVVYCAKRDARQLVTIVKWVQSQASDIVTALAFKTSNSPVSTQLPPLPTRIET